MPELVALLAIVGGIFFWIWRAYYAVQVIKEIDRDTKGLQRRARKAGAAVLGSRLERVQDPRFAATILMLQLVRTGGAVTAAEKTKIMELMDDPLRIANVETIFVQAWGYTEKRAFSPVADELTPLLRYKLTPDERLEFVDMLKAVANAYGEPSELQTEAINRLRRCLMMP